MSISWFGRSIALIIAAFILTSTTQAWPHRHSGKKARVHFLAEGTLIRNTWGWNEDTYLAKLHFSKQNESVLVRLVDGYPNEFPPLPRKAMTDDKGTMLAVNRDLECDRPFGQMLLRTAPGDPMAIVLDPLVYHPPNLQLPAPEAILPCYRVVRRQR